MDLESLLHKLEEAIADEIREDMDNPLDEYDLEKWD